MNETNLICYPVGSRWSRLVVLAHEPHSRVRVRCECGVEKSIAASRYMRSCGCLSREMNRGVTARKAAMAAMTALERRDRSPLDYYPAVVRSCGAAVVLLAVVTGVPLGRSPQRAIEYCDAILHEERA